MQAETWINQYCDEAVFIGDRYVIYNKCDRLGVDCIDLIEPRHETDMERIKKAYYKNGFRPVEDNSKLKSHYCEICEHLGSCGKDEGCCGDDVLSKPCCTCTKGIMCPGHSSRTDNFKLKKIEAYESK